MTIKAAPKPKSKSKTPLLDASRVSDPHVNGWDKVAAQQLTLEAIEQVKGNDLDQFLKLAVAYKNVAGWKNLLVGMCVKRGLITSRNFQD